MANIKISELEELVNVAEDDYFPIVDTSTSKTKKIKVAYVGVGGKSGDTLPIGSISAYSGEEIPSNWLKCNGQAISRTTYADLFSVIGTTYGSGDASTTFNVPNISERVIVGNNGDGEFSLGNTGGEKEHKLIVSEMPAHGHKLPNDGAFSVSSDGSSASGITFGKKIGTSNLLSTNSGGNQPHNNMQPYIALNYIIKAKQSVGIVGTVTSDINDTNDNAVPNAKTVKDYVGTDTGWVDLPLNTGVLAAVSKYRKIGKMVEVIITNLRGYEFQETFVTLPEEIRPTYGFRCICPSYMTSYVRLEVYNKDGDPGSGSIYPDKKGAMHIQNSSSGNKEWVDINITYFI